ncbi:hypothetical protein REPUB_Repub01dG0175700 [Reevesia pubescens]
MAVFVKVLTITDVERRLSFPDRCIPDLQRFEGCQIMLPVKDDAGMLWNFGCVIRYGSVRKLVIVTGWIQFVQSKDLHEDDVVVLYKEDDVVTGAHYKIEVKRSDKFCK